MNDTVNNPKHYNQNGIEVIDVIETYAKSDFRLANVIKYVCRCEYKGNKLEDLKKAQWYLARVIAELEELPELSTFEEHELYVHEGATPPKYGYTEREAKVFYEGYECRKQEELETGVCANDPKPSVYVQPSPDRIAGDDDAAKRVKAKYYGYDGDEIISLCKNPSCQCPIYADELYVVDEKARLFCSTICEQLLRSNETMVRR